LVAAKHLTIMASDPSKPARRAPIIVWCIRLFLCAVIFWFGKYWLVSIAGRSFVSEVTLGGFVGLSSVVLTASFIHSKFSIILLIVSVIVIPLAFFLAMDTLVLKGASWEWYMLVVQMGIPLAVSYYMWKSPEVRNYFQQTP